MIKKTLFPKHHQNPQQRRPPVIYDNYATPNSNPYNQNDPDVQRAIFMSMNPPLRNSAEAAHPTYQTNYYNNEYARGLPISLSGPNSQINVNNTIDNFKIKLIKNINELLFKFINHSCKYLGKFN